MHEMRSTAIDDLAVMRLHPAKTAERIDVLFEVKTGEPRIIVSLLDGVGPDSPQK